MFKTFLFASIGAVAFASAGVAVAAQPQGPEPYSAPDPVYSAPQVQSSVTINNHKPVPSLTDNQASSSH